MTNPVYKHTPEQMELAQRGGLLFLSSCRCNSNVHLWLNRAGTHLEKQSSAEVLPQPET